MSAVNTEKGRSVESGIVRNRYGQEQSQIQV